MNRVERAVNQVVLPVSRELGRIAAPDAGRQAPLGGVLAQDRQRGLRQLDSVDVDARLQQIQIDAAGATAEFEDGAVD